MNNDFTKKITEIILSNCNIDEADWPDDVQGLSLTEDLEYDSLCFMNLIVELEKEFSISFDDTELLIDNLDDCSKLIDYVCELVKEQEDNGGVKNE